MRIRILAAATVTAGALMATLTGAASAATPEPSPPADSPGKGKIISVICEAGGDRPTVTVRELTDAEAEKLAKRFKGKIEKAVPGEVVPEKAVPGEAGGADHAQPGEPPRRVKALEGKPPVVPPGAGERPEGLPEGAEKIRILQTPPGEPPTAGGHGEKSPEGIPATCAELSELAPAPVPDSDSGSAQD
ncbi:hypothetical protein GCM10010156_52050 [Planobispora rosea]|uniref:Secreted protein n=1 Tax=Planobispora rosea TaxID=35762 RepID=A0A8J3S631_PLARO|nr:hypothetical protein [Planobispora rosea]GGS87165.1 hypothetical protein GCM10010156_52050 [Planobispora rosea]GIH86607.1 hypothetical protein Pro02_50150 [Planobispora rosea]